MTPLKLKGKAWLDFTNYTSQLEAMKDSVKMLKNYETTFRREYASIKKEIKILDYKGLKKRSAQ